jgi:YidC/Oxa1 family membrane protein insertase
MSSTGCTRTRSSRSATIRALAAPRVTRTYRLTDPTKPGHDPYRIHHETTFRNLTETAAQLGQPTLALGTATLLNDKDNGLYLTGVSFDGNDATYTERSELEGARFFGSREPKPILTKPGTLVWAGVKNQFFTTVYTPEKPGSALVVKRLDLTTVAPFANSQQPNIAVTAAARFGLDPLPASGTAKLAGMLYVGPQERERLARFEHEEARLLPYTQYFFNRIFFSRYVAPALNFLMNQINNWVGNWGVAIVLMTLMLKVISLPFTLAASRSAKRMAKIQPELQAIREKYKDNPQKQQQATLEVFKSHKVNPVGGCIPILITMPLFIGFFAMLQCTAELRFQSFLWAPDLSAPDTIASPWGIPINIMPLLMGATMWFQMKLTPTPSVDNMQMKMMQFMPIVFTFICYNFSCALSLYSTINGLFTIGQQMVINKMKDPDVGPAGAGTAAATTASMLGKGMKNVTPKDKKLK